jgi:hypothetical protein
MLKVHASIVQVAASAAQPSGTDVSLRPVETSTAAS